MTVKVSAELILEIDKLLSNARKAETAVKGVGEAGAESGLKLNRGFGRGIEMPVRTGGMDRLRLAMQRNQEHVAKFAAGVGGSLAALDGGEMLNGFQRDMEAAGDRLKVVAGIAAGAGVAFGGAFVASSIKAAGALQDIELQIARFSGGLERAKQLMSEGVELGIKTPFETNSIYELQAGLLAAGDASKDLMEDIRRLAAVAQDDQALGELGTVFAQGITNQRFDLERIRQFTDRRVNVLPALQSVMGTDMDGVLKAISEGKVGVEEMRKALDNLRGSGGQFFGLMEARSKTLPGLWSTAASAAAEIRAEFGKASVRPLSQGLEVVINELMPKAIERAGQWGEAMANQAAALAAVFQMVADEGLGKVGESFAKSFADGLAKVTKESLTVLMENGTSKNMAFQAGQSVGAQHRQNFSRDKLIAYQEMRPTALVLDNAFNPNPATYRPGLLTKAIDESIAHENAQIDRFFRMKMGLPATDAKPAESPQKPEPAKAPDPPKNDFVRQVTDMMQKMAVTWKDPLANIQPSAPIPMMPETADTAQDAATTNQAPAPVSRTVYNVPGEMQAAVNRVSGRPAYTLFAESMTEQTREIKALKGVMERIEKKMTEEVVLKQSGPDGSRFS